MHQLISKVHKEGDNIHSNKGSSPEGKALKIMELKINCEGPGIGVIDEGQIFRDLQGKKCS